MTSTPTDHDAYIAAAPERFRPLLQHLRQVLGEALPDAEEIVAYGMPGYARSGTTVTSDAAFSKQVGVYFLGAALAEHADDIAAAGFRATKTGITFPPHKPLPDDLISSLARASHARTRTTDQHATSAWGATSSRCFAVPEPLSRSSPRR